MNEITENSVDMVFVDPIYNLRKNYQNIFQIWKVKDEKLPLAVRRWNWDERYYAVVERVIINRFPYGYAYGFAVAEGKYSDHFSYDCRWRKEGIIPNCGSYQWELVEEVELDKNKLKRLMCKTS